MLWISWFSFSLFTMVWADALTYYAGFLSSFFIRNLVLLVITSSLCYYLIPVYMQLHFDVFLSAIKQAKIAMKYLCSPPFTTYLSPASFINKLMLISKLHKVWPIFTRQILALSLGFASVSAWNVIPTSRLPFPPQGFLYLCCRSQLKYRFIITVFLQP